MKKLIKRIILTLASAGMILAPVMLPAVVMAADVNPALCAGADLSATDITNTNCDTVAEGGAATVQKNVKLIINIFSWIVGVAAVIMIMVGGFMYISSGGDSAKVGKAKDTILYAIIGLVVVAIAQMIVKFVIGQINT